MFNQQELNRYDRHFKLAGFGKESQLRLKNSSVLIIGVGGLGSPCALYLAASGVGKIGLVDYDQVDLSNLQRQIIYKTNQVGLNKVEQAKLELESLNPNSYIQDFNLKLNKVNILRVIEDYDLIIDGTDNFASRYLINDSCLKMGKPFVSAAIHGFEGQLKVFNTNEGGCYRCLYPTPPPAASLPSCNENGVLGVLPGALGVFQATEAIKFITGIGELLTHKLLLYNALTMQTTTIKSQKDPNCSACTKKFYASFESENSDEILLDEYIKIFHDQRDHILIDVREQQERQQGFIDPSLHIPLNYLGENCETLNKNSLNIVYCESGIRSLQAVEFLKQKGFSQVKSLFGGFKEYKVKNL